MASDERYERAPFGWGGVEEFAAVAAPIDFAFATTSCFGERPIERYRREARAIESAVEPIEAGYTRLWRGERPGQNGNGLNFTNDLPGIALPFRESYRGELIYLDIPSSELAGYEMAGAVAPGSEFHLPPEIAQQAKAVPSQHTIATGNEIPAGVLASLSRGPASAGFGSSLTAVSREGAER